MATATATATAKTAMTTTAATATATVTAAMMMTMTAAVATFVALAVGWLLHCCLPRAIVVACRTLSCDRRRSRRRRLSPPLPLQSLVGTMLSSPANVQYSIPSSPRCPQTLSSPAAARLFHSSRWLVVASSVTIIRYFGTYLRYLPTSPMSHHCDNIPANPSWITDIFRYHFRHSTSSSTVELVYSVRILFDDTSQKL